jgi:nicotinate-nucleotide adenylyltransferase
MRIGVFGGSFDPVHLGHLLAAECCREQARLDRVIFVPAALAPHKPDRQPAAAEHRLQMLALATGGHPAFAVSRLEIDRGGVSYTVDTLAELAVEHPSAELLLMLGPDALAQLPSWREPRRIVERHGPLVVEREGLDDVAGITATPEVAALLGTEGRDRITASLVRMPAIGIRSSQIRAALAAGRSIRFRTPRAVEAYIEAQRIYREA